MIIGNESGKFLKSKFSNVVQKCRTNRAAQTLKDNTYKFKYTFHVT